MQTSLASSLLWEHVSKRVAELTGLYFPPGRRRDLERGVAQAAEELGFSTTAACADWLASATLTGPELEVIAGCLTVGETYFFREQKMFDAIAENILPAIVKKRSAGERRLRIWSAACCTGEEPYSLAILLSQYLPEPSSWHVTILATDINERFLRKAAVGIYGEWSFRETQPGFKERYFSRTSDGRYAILPEIRRRVTFAHVNLADDIFPSLVTDTNAMDIIVCRNVLMYFTVAQARKTIANLRRSLVDDGWLAVSASEGSHLLFSSFENGNFPGTLIYRKTDGAASPKPAPRMAVAANRSFATRPSIGQVLPGPAVIAPPPERLPVPMAPPPSAQAAQLYGEGRYAEASEILLEASTLPKAAEEFSILARSLANQGRLSEAFDWCDQWVRADKLDAAAHYVRAMVLQELGQPDQARSALQRAIYLRPELVLAHFSLGMLANAAGRREEAQRHFQNTLRLLATLAPGEPLPESDGLTASRLTEIVQSVLTVGGQS